MYGFCICLHSKLETVLLSTSTSKRPTSTATAAVEAAAALEELLEDFLSVAAKAAREAARRERRSCERTAAASRVTGRRVVGIVTLVEAGAQLWIREHFVGFVDSGHLSFTAALVRVSLDDGFTAGGRGQRTSWSVCRLLLDDTEQGGRTYYPRLIVLSSASGLTFKTL